MRNILQYHETSLYLNHRLDKKGVDPMVQKFALGQGSQI